MSLLEMNRTAANRGTTGCEHVVRSSDEAGRRAVRREPIILVAAFSRADTMQNNATIRGFRLLAAPHNQERAEFRVIYFPTPRSRAGHVGKCKLPGAATRTTMQQTRIARPSRIVHSIQYIAASLGAGTYKASLWQDDPSTAKLHGAPAITALNEDESLDESSLVSLSDRYNTSEEECIFVLKELT